MRITRMRVAHWRQLREIEVHIPEHAGLVCLVGDNGTGKSSLLEFISAALSKIGISGGVDIARGNPLLEPHDVQIDFRVPELVRREVLGDVTGHYPEWIAWDGTLELRSGLADGSAVGSLVARGLTGSAGADLARQVANHLRSRRETQHLYLDADRSYSAPTYMPQHLADFASQPWGDPEWARQFAHKPTKAMYDEWIKYVVTKEDAAAGARLIADRAAVRAGELAPIFEDPFEAYAAAVEAVLPHLNYSGVHHDGRQRVPVFSVGAAQVPFHRLSAGEREIAFILGQVDRFRLRRGLLLIDEPELHLNPDLIRRWLGYLSRTLEEGQIWIATHSSAAVEVAGAETTFVLSREQDLGSVSAATPLSAGPAAAGLRRAVGAPGFSVNDKLFVYVEAEAGMAREPERYRRLLGERPDYRIISGGSGSEVSRRVRDVAALAAESGEEIRVAGVLDRDFKSSAEIDSAMVSGRIVVLECHEIENLFVAPPLLSHLAAQMGIRRTSESMLQEAGTRLASLWVSQRTRARLHGDGLDVPRSLKKAIADLAWDERARWAEQLRPVLSEQSVEESKIWIEQLLRSRDEYELLLGGEGFWRESLGKQMVACLAPLLGFVSAEHLIQTAHVAISSGVIDELDELKNLRAALRVFE